MPTNQSCWQLSINIPPPPRIAETSGLDGRVEHAPHFKNLEFLFPETTRNFSQLPLQYKGFCGYSIAVHDRLLLPGKLGVLNCLKFNSADDDFESF